MKQSVQLQEAQARMAPGIVSLDGFLGDDRRSLVEIIASDEAESARLGLDLGAAADLMRELRDAGYEGQGESVAVPPHFEVRVDSERGKLPCPFGDRGGIRKTVVTVLNTRLGRSLRFTDLGIHLLREHGFFEGRGSPFRIEPAELRDVLELGEKP